MNLDTIKYLLSEPGQLVSMLGRKGKLNWMPDKMYLQILAKCSLGHRIDFSDPKTFNEKLQWIKLYDRDPLYTQLVDKYTVRDYVAEKIGEEHLIPLVGGPWSTVDEIDFDALPNEFVLKASHDSGGVIICRDKKSFDIEAAKQKLKKRMKINFYWGGREWPYKNVKPCIIAEKYMVDESGKELKDYKILCFNGQPKLVQLHRGRFSEHTQDYYDTDWNKLDIIQGCPNSDVFVEKPEFIDEMFRLSESLTTGIPHVRADWYYAENQVYFGELTFFDSSGFDEFEPVEWNRILGDWIKLN